MAAKSETSGDAVAPSWSELLVACDDYARQAGWRYVEHDFMKLNASDGRAAARAAALPTALEFGDRLRALRPDDDSPLVQEFRGCQRVVAASAVHNTLLATVRALGLWPTDAPPQLFDTAWQDCEGADAPTIARRLRNYEATFDANPAAQAQRRERLLKASFVVEFGLAHGLPDAADPTAECMLKEFLERVREWGGGRDAATQELVRSLVLGSLPSDGTTADGVPVPRSVRAAALDWFGAKPGVAVLAGGALLGLVGAAAAGAAIVVAKSRRR